MFDFTWLLEGGGTVRKILVIVGSPSDLPQCENGQEILSEWEKMKQVKVRWVNGSIHRHTLEVLEQVRIFSREPGAWAIIAGAGMAAHLPGMIDSFLRHTLLNYEMPVFACGFTGIALDSDLAAELSITHVPGTQVIFCGVGSIAFANACLKAVKGKKPQIMRPGSKPYEEMTLDQAMERTQEVKAQ